MTSGNNSVCSFQNSAPEMNDQQEICTRRHNLTEIQPTLKKNSKDVSRGWRKKELRQRRLLNTIALKAANEDFMVKQEPSEIVFPLIKEESVNELPADGDVCVKQEPSELGFPPIKEELDEPPADADLCVKQEPSELGFPPIKEELDEPPADGDVCVKQEPSELGFPPIKEELDEPPADADLCVKQEPSELGFPPIKEELDEPPADGDVCVKQEPSELGFPPIKEELDEPCEDSWQPEPGSSSASQDYTLCKQQVKEEITIEEHPIAAAGRWRRLCEAGAERAGFPANQGGVG
ncbi:fibrous sheath CABYR-binding protein-like isoform X22 [Bacillus rossius redtenbacheri]|uniref:fibrous sheath CABYR-binding protein-like isoform X22 n=1 Tax=Bacillus rossius redtenbacheri TaxID=93214 RepID=UPI002FDCA785